MATIADEAVASARELFALVAADRARVLAHEGMSIATLRLFELLPRHPVVTVASAMKLVETTKPTAGRSIELLVTAGVLAETTGKKRIGPSCTGAISTACAWAPISRFHHEVAGAEDGGSARRPLPHRCPNSLRIRHRAVRFDDARRHARQHERTMQREQALADCPRRD